MSRLYDRMLAFGCERFRPRHLSTLAEREELRARVEEEVRERFTHAASIQPDELERLVAYASSQQAVAEFEPVAIEKFDSAQLEGIPVIAADEVAEYCARFPDGTHIDEVVTTLAPPFDRFFVDIQHVRNKFELNAWGVLVEHLADLSDDEDEVGWHLMLTLLIERDKNDPIGPVARFFLALDRDGLWLRNDDGSPVWVGTIVDFDKPAPEEIAQQTTDTLVPLVLPALMTASFMHCKNVRAEPVDPAEARSRRWRKKRGRPLTRYHVLQIAPMREMLEREGQASERGLGHALHICRGHFKTFTEEAPLFGRVTGQFWWDSHARGNAKRGRVEKDYHVRVERPGLGRPYVDVDESVALAERTQTSPDPDVGGRGLRAHNVTQNLLATAVRRAGLEPRRPRPIEPQYDLGWEVDETICVAEVKSLTAQTEERQLRLAIGQVVRYRYQLARAGAAVQAVIAVERKPRDGSWIDLCHEHGITLTWPETFPLLFKDG